MLKKLSFFRYAKCNPSSQSGIALVVALVFVTNLALLGVSVVIVTMNEEKMGRNYGDQDKAFQAAEIALRDAEVRINGKYLPARAPIDNGAFLTARCDGGLCSIDSDQSHFEILKDGGGFVLGGVIPKDTVVPTGAIPTPLKTGSPLVRDVSSQPRYLIQPVRRDIFGQDINSPLWAYRISAIGFGSKNAMVLLQELYQPDMPAN